MNTPKAAAAAAGIAALKAAIVELGKFADALERVITTPEAAATAPADAAVQDAPASPAPAAPAETEGDLRKALSDAIVAAIAAGHKAAAQQAMRDLGFAGSLSSIPAADLPKHIDAVRALVAPNG